MTWPRLWSVDTPHTACGGGRFPNNCNLLLELYIREAASRRTLQQPPQPAVCFITKDLTVTVLLEMYLYIFMHGSVYGAHIVYISFIYCHLVYISEWFYLLVTDHLDVMLMHLLLSTGEITETMLKVVLVLGCLLSLTLANPVRDTV